MSLLPREHGAYGQMIFPLATALAVAGITTPAVLTALAVVAAFLAHEPLLVVLGLRGPRARREHGRRGAAWLAASLIVAAAAGLAAIWLMPADRRWGFALPLVPAALLVPAIVSRREKTWHAEVAVALAFSLAAVPVSLAAGATTAAAFTVAIPFALLFVAATLAVRVVILRVRGGGNPRAAAATRVAACAVAALGGLAVATGSAAGVLSMRTLLAALPGVATALVVALFPPPPARLKRIGWTLVGASLATAVLLVV